LRVCIASGVRCVGVYCSVLQRVAVCCSVLQCSNYPSTREVPYFCVEFVQWVLLSTRCVCNVCYTLQIVCVFGRGGGLGSRPKKRLGDGVGYHLMSPTPRRYVPFTTGRRAH